MSPYAAAVAHLDRRLGEPGAFRLDDEQHLRTLLGSRLTVWYGKMPESNGRENWTANLRRVNPTDKWDMGFCFARSEYPGRVLYEADRVRWLIGERAERPDILAYDADKRSSYVEPESQPVAWLRDAHEGEGDECLVPAAAGDPGAFPVYAERRV